MNYYMMTNDERKAMIDGIVRGIAESYTEREVLRACQTGVERVHIMKLGTYVRWNAEMEREALLSHVNAESRIDEINELAAKLADIAGRTNDPDFAVED